MAKYKDRKSSGCALCKPWKHGWEPKHKSKDRAKLEQMAREIKSIELISNRLSKKKISSSRRGEGE